MAITNELPAKLRIASTNFRNDLCEGLGEIPEGFSVSVKPMDVLLAKTQRPDEIFYKVSLFYDGPGFKRLHEVGGLQAGTQKGQACLLAFGSKKCQSHQRSFGEKVGMLDQKIRQTLLALATGEEKAE